MGFLFGDGGAVVFILFAGFALGVVFGWSLLEGRWSGGGGDGKIVAPVTEPVGEPVVEPRDMPRGAGLAEVIPLRPTGMGRIAEAARM
ncbi:MAG: hypothetical protein H0W55_11070 [Actinobacteria bacterium]|nr:hypothetical protein [Actinomycetota bacterium]MDQ3532112.1 hypothetical protein [Actinomycetota bacterium]